MHATNRTNKTRWPVYAIKSDYSALRRLQRLALPVRHSRGAAHFYLLLPVNRTRIEHASRHSLAGVRRRENDATPGHELTHDRGPGARAVRGVRQWCMVI
jgi:hypothetical protein